MRLHTPPPTDAMSSQPSRGAHRPRNRIRPSRQNLSLHHLVVLASALAPTSLASVDFTSPAAGVSLPGGTFTIAWKDDGGVPSLSDLASYGINLCAGGNAQGSFDCTLAKLVVNGKAASVGTAAARIPADAGPASLPGQFGYFLQFVAQDPTGSQYTIYSPRFALPSLVGTFKTPSLADAVAALPADTTQPPPSVSSLSSSGQGANNPVLSGVEIPLGAPPDGATSIPGEQGPWAVPYTLQTGFTRYAPMQPQPGSKITRSGTPSPLWPASSATIARTWLAPPEPVTTITQNPVFSVSSMENTAPALPGPSNGGQIRERGEWERYLDRWKD